MVKFIVVLVIAFFIAGFVSIAWPYITTAPRPAPLTALYSVVSQTPLGENTARVLGASTNGSTTPINISTVGKSVTSSVVAAAQHKAQEIITTHAVRELTKQFQTLPDDQKKQIQEVICKPQ